MTVELALYSTAYCHLCEQAELLLNNVSDQYDVHWTQIEISDDHSLLELYEIKIPVIRRLDNNREIYWPFSSSDITNLIK